MLPGISHDSSSANDGDNVLILINYLSPSGLVYEVLADTPDASE